MKYCICCSRDRSLSTFGMTSLKQHMEYNTSISSVKSNKKDQPEWDVKVALHNLKHIPNSPTEYCPMTMIMGLALKSASSRGGAWNCENRNLSSSGRRVCNKEIERVLGSKSKSSTNQSQPNPGLRADGTPCILGSPKIAAASI